MKKKSVWVKKRHNTIRHLVEKPIYRYLKKNYGFSYTPFDTKGQAYLILANHQTAMDQFIAQLPFKDYCYPIASEDIFSISLGKAISWAVAPIPITKGQINVSTILTCKQIAKQNKSIQLHPEGNRTYSGKTEYIAPAIAKLAKVLKLPIAFLVIRGGYGVRPRWSEEPRKGKMHAKVESVLLPEQYLSMTDEELYNQICQRLYVNESNDGGETYTGSTLAEYLERAIYYCPNCGVTHFYKEYAAEQFLAFFGMLTGTASTGIILLRVADDGFVSPVSDNLVYQNLPAIAFGFPLMFLATYIYTGGPQAVYITLALLALFFVILQLILFRRTIFKKKQTKVE